ncbi:MAG: hypothetical protein DMF25_06265 [Verrucomicrobia bacterium]|nr:MAG: hypothetical protein DMF25_06265 [Verrucomicrobiota bacterium]
MRPARYERVTPMDAALRRRGSDLEKVRRLDDSQRPVLFPPLIDFFFHASFFLFRRGCKANSLRSLRNHPAWFVAAGKLPAHISNLLQLRLDADRCGHPPAAEISVHLRIRRRKTSERTGFKQRCDRAHGPYGKLRPGRGPFRGKISARDSFGSRAGARSAGGATCRSFITTLRQGRGQNRLQHGWRVTLVGSAALRSGQIISIQGDRVVGEVTSLPATLFGHELLLPNGPFVLSRAAEVPIYPLFIVRRGYRKYRIIVRKPIICLHARPRREDDIAAAMQQWSAVLEEMINRYRAQWYAFTPIF